MLEPRLTGPDETGRPGQVMALQMRDVSALDSSGPLGSTGGKTLIACPRSSRDLTNGEVPAVYPREFLHEAVNDRAETQTQILP